MDISIVNSNHSMDICVEYCNKRGITTEFVRTEQDATGEFICVIVPDVYYEDYFLHYQYISLKFKKGGENYDHFAFRNIVVYDKNENDFYVGDFITHNKFYRSVRRHHPKALIEHNIFAGVCMLKLSELQVYLPSDNVLLNYHKCLGFEKLRED